MNARIPSSLKWLALKRARVTDDIERLESRRAGLVSEQAEVEALLLMAIAFTAASGVMIVYALISMTRPQMQLKTRKPFSPFDSIILFRVHPGLTYV